MCFHRHYLSWSSQPIEVSSLYMWKKPWSLYGVRKTYSRLRLVKQPNSHVWWCGHWILCNSTLSECCSVQNIKNSMWVFRFIYLRWNMYITIISNRTVQWDLVQSPYWATTITSFEFQNIFVTLKGNPLSNCSYLSPSCQHLASTILRSDSMDLAILNISCKCDLYCWISFTYVF